MAVRVSMAPRRQRAAARAGVVVWTAGAGGPASERRTVRPRCDVNVCTLCGIFLTPPTFGTIARNKHKISKGYFRRRIESSNPSDSPVFFYLISNTYVVNARTGKLRKCRANFRRDSTAARAETVSAGPKRRPGRCILCSRFLAVRHSDAVFTELSTLPPHFV